MDATKKKCVHARAQTRSTWWQETKAFNIVEKRLVYHFSWTRGSQPIATWAFSLRWWLAYKSHAEINDEPYSHDFLLSFMCAWKSTNNRAGGRADRASWERGQCYTYASTSVEAVIKRIIEVLTRVYVIALRFRCCSFRCCWCCFRWWFRFCFRFRCCFRWRWFRYCFRWWIGWRRLLASMSINFL